MSSSHEGVLPLHPGEDLTDRQTEGDVTSHHQTEHHTLEISLEIFVKI
jgi:hypothetical protein